MKNLWQSLLLSLFVYFFCPPGNDGYTAIFHHSSVFGVGYQALLSGID